MASMMPSGPVHWPGATGRLLDRLMMGAVDAHGRGLDDPMQEAFGVIFTG